MVSDEADFMLDICVVTFSGHPVPNSHVVIRIGSVNAVLFEMDDVQSLRLYSFTIYFSVL